MGHPAEPLPVPRGRRSRYSTKTFLAVLITSGLPVSLLQSSSPSLVIRHPEDFTASLVSMNAANYPDAVDPNLVGTYSAVAMAGGGYVWDEVLEYRVWCHPERGASDLEDGNDYYQAYATYTEALAFSRSTKAAEAPLALIRQLEYIEEPNPGDYRHAKKVRITEWPVEFLRRPRRTRTTIPDFLSPNAPANRLDILRGLANQNE